MTIVYRKRENIFLNGESEGRVEPDTLQWFRPDGTMQSLRWADVTSVRLRANPTMSKRWLHETVIEAPTARIRVDNSHFAGVSDFEDRSKEYSPFVRAALERVQALAPRARVQLGSSVASFAGLMAFVVVSFIALVAVLLLLPLPAPFPFVVVVKLGLIVYMLTLLPRWIKGNWPRTSDPASAANALP